MFKIRKAGSWLCRRAENISAFMLAVMFISFIVQVVFRYLLNFPIGTASELTIVMWLWVVLWGASFVLREEEEIRFDIVYGMVGRRARLVMTAVSALALILIYGISLPASWDYVMFMKVQKSSYLNIRYDFLYFIYIIFAVSVVGRYVWIFFAAVRGRSVREVGVPSDIE
ncbi:TRAP transporter small permease subunit [Pseudomonas azotifigens]|uniref:TRAP transporter small permease protein n=2 Tax=Stutzerimonas azotifigens TaxID=291995 RepID=A0ABR5Z2D5_9GAMM|nr:TRAP transporter small permease subunit [Stutzerimonas azotifigens]